MLTTPAFSQIMPPTAEISMGETIMSIEGIIRIRSFIDALLQLRRSPLGSLVENDPEGGP